MWEERTQHEEHRRTSVWEERTGHEEHKTSSVSEAQIGEEDHRRIQQEEQRQAQEDERKRLQEKASRQEEVRRRQQEERDQLQERLRLRDEERKREEKGKCAEEEPLPIMRDSVFVADKPKPDKDNSWFPMFGKDVAPRQQGKKQDATLVALRAKWLDKCRGLEFQGPSSFVDTEFPPSFQSLGAAAERAPGVFWARAAELFQGSPCILREVALEKAQEWDAIAVAGDYCGDAPGDSLPRQSVAFSKEVTQGLLGDCWLLSAMAVMCTRPDLLDQIFMDSSYVNPCGAYCFKLFRRGMDQQVVVDDNLPVKQMGFAVQPVFARARTGPQGEVVLWPMLLEKAFAKLYGSYGAIEAGLTHEALMDMTGGLGDAIIVDGPAGVPANLWPRLVQCKRSGDLLAAGSRGGSHFATSPRGIVQGHAYSILSVREIRGVQLLKLRNPWGKGEWTGDYGENSRLWTPELRAKLRWPDPEGGVFWISLRDFLCEFQYVFICRVFSKDTNKRDVIEGSWSDGPQRVYTLKVANKGKAPVCFQLEQEDVRGTWSSGAPIRLEVRPARMNAGPAPFGASPFQRMQGGSSSTPATAGREVALEVELDEGLHEVVAIIQAQSGGKFALTVFSENRMEVTISENSDLPPAPLGFGGRMALQVPANPGFGPPGSGPQGPQFVPAPWTPSPPSPWARQDTTWAVPSHQHQMPTPGVPSQMPPGMPGMPGMHGRSPQMPPMPASPWSPSPMAPASTGGPVHVEMVLRGGEHASARA